MGQRSLAPAVRADHAQAHTEQARKAKRRAEQAEAARQSFSD